jgi:hypothetical protein
MTGVKISKVESSRGIKTFSESERQVLLGLDFVLQVDIGPDSLHHEDLTAQDPEAKEEARDRFEAEFQADMDKFLSHLEPTQSRAGYFMDMVLFDWQTNLSVKVNLDAVAAFDIPEDEVTDQIKDALLSKK